LNEHKIKIAEKTVELNAQVNELAHSERPIKQELLNLESLLEKNIEKTQTAQLKINVNSLSKLKTQKQSINQKINNVKKTLKTLRNQMREKRRQIKLLKENTNNIHFDFDSMNAAVQPPRSEAVQKKPVVSFVRKCCSEGCPGFLTTQWRCPLCENYACSKCHELVGKDRNADSHKCKPENIATAELLNKDSKPCPTCGTLIHKISGCYEMFCTQCHNGFDWTSGKKLKNVHNPHFFEYMAAHGRPQQIVHDDYFDHFNPDHALYFTAGAKPLQIARTLLHLRDYANTNLNPHINPQNIN
jgi:hypothetical protein